MNIIDLNPMDMDQEELDFWERELKKAKYLANEDSKIILSEILQEQETRNELFDELLLD